MSDAALKVLFLAGYGPLVREPGVSAGFGDYTSQTCPHSRHRVGLRPASSVSRPSGKKRIEKTICQTAKPPRLT
jgi:hypothetical protein